MANDVENRGRDMDASPNDLAALTYEELEAFLAAQGNHYEPPLGQVAAMDIAKGGSYDMDVVAPGHYQGDGETTCIDAARSMMTATEEPPLVSALWLMAFRYLWRWPGKGRAKDLRKCREAIGMMLDEMGEGRW